VYNSYSIDSPLLREIPRCPPGERVIPNRVMISESQITNALKTVIDPELGYNIVDLGLIYKIDIADSSVRITMTLTTPGCPLAPFFASQVKEVISTAANLQPEDIDINLVFDPPWSPEAIHPDIRLELGL
jgi:metal-sulfur cluster biosynthetic enzyme